jgi:signal transduction histidine kinase
MSDLHEDLRHSLFSAGESSTNPRWFALPRLSKRSAVVASMTLLVMIGYADRMTGPELHFSLFYVFPVLLVTLFAGRRAGYLMAIICAVSRLIVELTGHAIYTRPIMAYWNTATRLCLFLLAASLLASFKDLSARLEAMVADRTKALRQLASQLSETEDLERRRLAHDIHDGFSQMLSVLKLNLAAALPEQQDHSPSNSRINDAITMVNELIQRARTLTFDLHPAMLDHLGFVPTLRQFGEQFGRQADLEVTVNEEGTPKPLPGVMANYLFRSIKELLNNAAKHGHARQIVASMYWSADRLRIVIDDDGSGFDPSVVFAPNVTKGLGLAAIHERLLSMGGSLRLESNVGTGTRVVLEVPLAGQEVIP